MNNHVPLTDAASGSIKELEELLAGITSAQLVETALAVTAALYRKTADGARIRVEYPDGKSEELRFRIKRPGRKKNQVQPG